MKVLAAAAATLFLAQSLGVRADSSSSAAAGRASSAASSTSTSYEVLPDGSSNVPNDSAETRGMSPKNATTTFVDHGQALLQWLRSTPGGYAHPALSIAPVATTTTQEEQGNNNVTADVPSSYYGMRSTDNIPKGETLLEIPLSMVMRPKQMPGIGDRVVVQFFDPDTGHPVDHPGVVTAIDGRDGTYSVRCDGDDDDETDIDPDHLEYENWPVNCGLVRMLAREMRLGDGSPFAPYVNYLKSLPKSNVPSAWSKSSQKLLKKVLGQNDDDDSDDNDDDDDEDTVALPPAEPFGWIESDWHGRCGGRNRHPRNGNNNPNNDGLEEAAYYMVKQRSWDDLLVPVFDMMSHRNGRWLNTDNVPFLDSLSNADDEDKEDGDSPRTIKVFANRDIAKGEEIYTSYNMCTDCVGRAHSGYGTPEILEDYGFVEDYPRRFSFDVPTGDVVFDIDYRYDETTGETLDGLEVSWLGDPPDVPALEHLEASLERLKAHNETGLNNPAWQVPHDERAVIQQYVDALIVALTRAIAKAQGYDDDAAVSTSMFRYPKLTMHDPERWITSRPETCNWKEAFHYDDWDNVAQYTTPYQGMEFDINPYMGEKGDLCFDLDTVVQMCTSYRPQYHEMFVHYPAQFIPKVERILFVGGGDSMLLHEALKYPTLKKVVGLELDQTVVRASFEHFGTQPHWDNDKVEWWFGDATKSLLVLPREYFGSFDLVLVDLSETVMALSVTSELDVMEALSLLVKPGGIMVQNEYEHFPDHMRIFQDTLAIHYYGVPVVCSQSLILASNGVDFLRMPVTDHRVPHLYDLLDDADVQHNIIRDYQRNETNPHHCDKYKGDTYKGESHAQTQSRIPGVVLIVEVEETTVDLTALSDLTRLITGALAEEGLIVQSSVTEQYESGCKLAFVLREGYLIVRTEPPMEYVSLDLHFWSDFGKQYPVQRRIAGLMGGRAKGTSSSAFRIVASGMHGLKDHTRHAKSVGPHLEDFCSAPFTPINKDSSIPARKLKAQDLVAEALVASLDVLDDKSKYSVAVLCGPKHTTCPSANLLKNNPAVQSVVTISSCDGIAGESGLLDARTAELMMECEGEVEVAIANSPTKIRAIVVDPTATYQLAQITGRILKGKAGKNQYMADDVFVHATVVDGAPWRKAFVDLFRTGAYGADPVFRADVGFETLDQSGTNFTVVMTSSGSTSFPKAISQFCDRMERATGYVSRVNDIRSGNFRYEADFEARSIFYHDSYDRTDQQKQWTEQQPIGLQSIVQMAQPTVEEDGDDDDLSCAKLQAEFPAAMSSVLSSVPRSHVSTLAEATGDGCVLVYLWETGTAVVTFDGRRHVDLNVFLQGNGKNDGTKLEASQLQLRNELQERVGGGLSTLLSDQFPRGSDRTTHYPKPDRTPLWH
jgi:Spermine/spermidine synthase domain/SET domain